MQSQVSAFYKWFPVLPFIIYWLFSALVFHIGPFVNNSLNISTYFYLTSMFFLFIFSYNIGLKCIKSYRIHKSEFISPLKILKWTSIFAFIGTFLFVFDRINSGAGSFDIVLNEMANLRGDYAHNTTLLTTIAVLPQSFRLIAFASYFFCLMKKIRVSKFSHAMILGIMILDIINMILSANRGTLFWTMTYLFFYVIFCKRLTFKSIFLSKKGLIYKVIVCIAIVLSLSYFYYVASNRTVKSALAFSGQQASSSIRYTSLFERADFATIGTIHQLSMYLTHEFEYIDFYLKNAELINFDPISPLGLRVNMQIKRFFPEYVSSTSERVSQWPHLTSLMPSGWASIFGRPLAFFGLIGTVLFFVTLGFISGKCVGAYLKTTAFGWFVLVFLVYVSLNMSFDWILNNFDQYMCFFIAVILINRVRIRQAEGHTCTSSALSNNIKSNESNNYPNYQT